MEKYYYLDKENKEQVATTDESNEIKKNIFITGKYKLHNKNGPACIDHKLVQWFINGLLNRLDGPASANSINGNFDLSSEDEATLSNVSKLKKHNQNIDFKYYIDGKLLKLKEFSEKTNHLICKYCDKFCNQDCFFTIKNRPMSFDANLNVQEESGELVQNGHGKIDYKSDKHYVNESLDDSISKLKEVLNKYSFKEAELNSNENEKDLQMKSILENLKNVLNNLG